MKWFKSPITIGRITIYLWAGAWSIYDRNGHTNDLYSPAKCNCHTFSLYVGPFGIEVD